MNTKKVAKLGMLIALAFILNYVEAMIPISLGIPGIKLGLSNIVIVYAIYEFPLQETMMLAVFRIVLSGLTFGSLSTMIYSFAGGVFSLIIMLILKHTNKFSIYGVSIVGGVFHNVGQIIVAILILQTNMLIYYLPILLVAGTIAGTGIGIISAFLIKRLKPLNIK